MKLHQMFDGFVGIHQGLRKKVVVVAIVQVESIRVEIGKETTNYTMDIFGTSYVDSIPVLPWAQNQAKSALQPDKIGWRKALHPKI